MVGKKHGVIGKTGALTARLYDDSAWNFIEGLLTVQDGDMVLRPDGKPYGEVARRNVLILYFRGVSTSVVFHD